MAKFAEAVVSSFVNRLGDQLSQYPNSLLEVRKQVEWVESQFRWMQAFLKDAEAKSDKDERVKNWIREVRNLAYLAEDIIDTFLVEIAPSMQQGVSGAFGRINARHKLLSQIEEMEKKIRSISEDRVAYGIEDIRSDEGTSTAGQSREDPRLLSPYVEEPDFVGFQADLEILMQQLSRREPRRSVISIVGMGGQGKTTLARKLYQSDAIQSHFHPCLWISVSQLYGVPELLKAIMQKCMGTSADNMDTFELRHRIAQHLKAKRYLVVLDDVWTRQAWDDLKDAFPNTSNGSRVLLTTRNEDVALHADPTSKPHKLRFLDEDESWELFLKKAFLGHLEANSPIDSQQLRKEILSKCQGLPLAIVVIGGLLSRRKEAREWQHILKSIAWQLIEGEDRISGILSLSYRDLPYYLKPCFLYLGVFPEDSEIPAKKLIRLWVAEGFLEERGALTLEEVGEECLRELIRRSLIQPAAISSSGAIKSCRIHDLLRDFILSEVEEDAFLEVKSLAAASKPCKGRRLSVDRFDFLNHSPSYLRSLFILRGAFRLMRPRGEEMLVIRSFKLLRVLDVQGTLFEHLVSEIGELIHLRYLDCQVTRVRFPTNIGNLVNLQTLRILSIRSVIRVPIVVLEMQQLRHVLVRGSGVSEPGGRWIEIDGCPCVDQSWSNSNLRTLKNVMASKWVKNGLLGRLRKLRKLGINIRGCVESAWESIMRLKSLESLRVSAAEKRRPWMGCLGQVPPLKNLPNLCKLGLEGKLENASVLCELPRNLTKLTLEESELEQDPLPILEKLENLRILKLEYSCYNGEKMACTAGGFPRLQSFSLTGLFKLREWRVEKGSMPCLTHLRIKSCSLKEVPDGVQRVTSLKILELIGMGRHFTDRVGRDGGEDWYKVQHIPSIAIR